jgi:hypothetical protein
MADEWESVVGLTSYRLKAFVTARNHKKFQPEQPVDSKGF